MSNTIRLLRSSSSSWCWWIRRKRSMHHRDDLYRKVSRIPNAPCSLVAYLLIGPDASKLYLVYSRTHSMTKVAKGKWMPMRGCVFSVQASEYMTTKAKDKRQTLGSLPPLVSKKDLPVGMKTHNDQRRYSFAKPKDKKVSYRCPNLVSSFVTLKSCVRKSSRKVTLRSERKRLS